MLYLHRLHHPHDLRHILAASWEDSKSLVKLKMEATCPSEKSVLLSRATRRHSPEDNILPESRSDMKAVDLLR
jgi:hypothetical protein